MEEAAEIALLLEVGHPPLAIPIAQEVPPIY
jgi:hypothetical protein